MNPKNTKLPPRWLLAGIAAGALIACGINIGLLTVEGVTSMRLLQALGYAGIGLLVGWMVYLRR